MQQMRQEGADAQADQDAMKLYSSIQQQHMNFDAMVKQSKNRVDLIKGKHVAPHK